MALRCCVALLLGVLAWPSLPAHAQTFSQSPFGYGPPRAYRYRDVPPYRYRYVPPYGAPFTPYSSDAEEEPPAPRGGIYRTLCVRLCDGFYFPISDATTQDGFARDADMCNASCSADARLFYYPSIGGDVDSMVDLTGMAYSALPNAFRYRKTLVEGCRCRPQPWSQTELQRHRAYAAGLGGGPPRDAEVIAGGERTEPRRARALPAPADGRAPPRVSGIGPPAVPAADDPGFVARPSPVVREIEPQRTWPNPAFDIRNAPRPARDAAGDEREGR